jgi:hypothetical protein
MEAFLFEMRFLSLTNRAIWVDEEKTLNVCKYFFLLITCSWVYLSRASGCRLFFLWVVTERVGLGGTEKALMWKYSANQATHIMGTLVKALVLSHIYLSAMVRR